MHRDAGMVSEQTEDSTGRDAEAVRNTIIPRTFSSSIRAEQDLRAVTQINQKVERWRMRIIEINENSPKLASDLARAKDEEAQWALLYSAQKQHASDLERSLGTKKLDKGDHLRKLNFSMEGWQRKLAKLLHEEREAAEALKACRPADWDVLANVAVRGDKDAK